MKISGVGIKLAFILVFAVLAYIGSQVNFSALMGADNQFFTLFQFFGPISGAFLGPWVGAAAVLLSETINFLLLGRDVTLLNLLRLTPMLFAAVYFGSTLRKKINAISWVPVVAIVGFVLHPVGQQVWFYALFWIIPLLMNVLFPSRLFAKSLGATFTAHSVGGLIWIWTVPSTPVLWLNLIPIVAFERTLFALGISGSYLLFNTALAALEERVPSLSKVVRVNTAYILSRKLFRGRA